MPNDMIWNCSGCSTALTTAYCPTCGEAVPTARDLTLRGLAYQLFQAITSVDGRFISSFRSLLTKPGLLTRAYLDGRKKPYLAPFQLFLLANLAFFAIQSVTRTNIVGSPLESHLHVQDWHGVANELVARKLQSRGLSLDQYSALFDMANQFNAKSLIILMVLPFGLMVAAICQRRDRPFAGHMVFAVHFYSFLLLLYSSCLLAAEASILLGGPGLGSAVLDTTATVFCAAACTAYLYLALGRVYAGHTVTKAIKAFVLAAAVVGILVGYRFLLFLITLATT